MKFFNALLFLAVLNISSIAQNLIRNGDFSQGMQDWDFGDYSNVAQDTIINGELQINISTAQSDAWGVQLMQSGISLAENKTYILTFDARADVNKEIFVSMGSGTDQTVSLSTDAKSCTTSFAVPNGSNPTVRLDFNIGKTTGYIYIDNINLKEFVPVPDTSLSAKDCKFPTNSRYPYGIKPSSYSQSQMNEHCMDWFKKWKDKYVTSEGCEPGEYRVQRIETGDANTNDCVSEGIGYGMLITVYMHNDTNNTKALFDGFWRFYCRYKNDNNLMNWRIYKDGTVHFPGGAAIDADEDVAFALFMAHRQWGSSGEINYFNEAIDLSNSILQHEITAGNDIRPGDSWDLGNPSYFAPAAYTIFKKGTGLSRWGDVAKHTYTTIVDYYYNSQETFDSTLGLYTGLQPNWCDYAGGESGPGTWAMDYNSFWWDACRAPWRQGYDYLLNGVANSEYAKLNSVRISTYFKTKYNGDPSKIVSHYSLNGKETPWTGDPNPTLGAEDMMNLAGFVGAIAISAMAGDDQEWLDALYKRLVEMPMCETGVDWGTDYFCDILKMIYLLTLTGNMPDFYSDFEVEPVSAIFQRAAKNRTSQQSLLVHQFQSSLKIYLPVSAGVPVTLQLLTINGKLINTGNFISVKNRNEYIMQLDHSVVPGTYLVRAIAGDQVKSGKLVVSQKFR